MVLYLSNIVICNGSLKKSTTWLVFAFCWCSFMSLKMGGFSGISTSSYIRVEPSCSSMTLTSEGFSRISTPSFTSKIKPSRAPGSNNWVSWGVRISTFYCSGVFHSFLGPTSEILFIKLTLIVTLFWHFESNSKMHLSPTVPASAEGWINLVWLFGVKMPTSTHITPMGLWMFVLKLPSRGNTILWKAI